MCSVYLFVCSLNKDSIVYQIREMLCALLGELYKVDTLCTSHLRFNDVRI